MANKRKNPKKKPKSKRLSRKELEEENIRLMVKQEQTEAQMNVKYLRKLEKKIKNLEIINKTHELNIERKNRELVELATKIVSEESFQERLDRKGKKLVKGLVKK